MVVRSLQGSKRFLATRASRLPTSSDANAGRSYGSSLGISSVYLHQASTDWTARCSIPIEFRQTHMITISTVILSTTDKTPATRSCVLIKSDGICLRTTTSITSISPQALGGGLCCQSSNTTCLGTSTRWTRHSARICLRASTTGTCDIILGGTSVRQPSGDPNNQK